jgi:hypothetical protein
LYALLHAKSFHCPVDYNKILKGDLSDFAGTWANAENEELILKSNGAIISDSYDSAKDFRLNEGGYYTWTFYDSNHDYITMPGPGASAWLFPVGVKLPSNIPDATDTTKVRLFAGQDFWPRMDRKIFYRVSTTESKIDPATPSDWATTAVDSARSNGIIPDSLDAKYQTNITRQEFCELAAPLCEKLTGKPLPNSDSSAFTDVNSSSTYSADVLKMAALGVVSGAGDKKFGSYCVLECYIAINAGNELFQAFAHLFRMAYLRRFLISHLKRNKSLFRIAVEAGDFSAIMVKIVPAFPSF